MVKFPAGNCGCAFAPSYRLDPFSNPNSIAYYQAGNDQLTDAIYIFDPRSFAYAGYSKKSGWQAELQQVITHEYAHFAHQREFDKAGKLMDWVGEGIAEYASESSRINEARYAAEKGYLIPIIDPSDTIYKQDLMHLYLLEADVSLAYARIAGASYVYC